MRRILFDVDVDDDDDDDYYYYRFNVNVKAPIELLKELSTGTFHLFLHFFVIFRNF